MSSSFVILTYCYFILLVSCARDNTFIGHLTVTINPHLIFILCSLTQEEKKESILQLININDVLNNEICIESSYFDLSTQRLVLNMDPLRLIKMSGDLGISYFYETQAPLTQKL